MFSNCSVTIFPRGPRIFASILLNFQHAVDSVGPPAGIQASPELGMATACISQLAVRGRQSHLSYQCRGSGFCPQTWPCAQPTGHGPTQDLPGDSLQDNTGLCPHWEELSSLRSSVSTGGHGKKRWRNSEEKLPVPGWLSGGALSSENPAEEGLGVENWGFGFVLCAVQTVSSVLWLVMFCFPGNLLRGPSLPKCMSLADLSSVNWPRISRFFSLVLPANILASFLFLCHFYMVWLP